LTNASTTVLIAGNRAARHRQSRKKINYGLNPDIYSAKINVSIAKWKKLIGEQLPIVVVTANTFSFDI
jgi:hypothetical protein